MPSFQPYWGKPAVRNDRGDRGDVGIIRSPVRASILPDCGGRPVMGVPTAIADRRLFRGFVRVGPIDRRRGVSYEQLSASANRYNCCGGSRSRHSSPNEGADAVGGGGWGGIAELRTESIPLYLRGVFFYWPANAFSLRR